MNKGSAVPDTTAHHHQRHHVRRRHEAAAAGYGLAAGSIGVAGLTSLVDWDTTRAARIALLAAFVAAAVLLTLVRRRRSAETAGPRRCQPQMSALHMSRTRRPHWPRRRLTG
jgi:hypothetical protein